MGSGKSSTFLLQIAFYGPAYICRKTNFPTINRRFTSPDANFEDSYPLTHSYPVKDLFKKNNTFEPRHDKTNKMSVRPVKTQISLGIRPV